MDIITTQIVVLGAALLAIAGGVVYMSLRQAKTPGPAEAGSSI